jgi:hypothetical protein
MTRLFKSAAGRGLTSSRYARLGQPPTGDLQKRRYTNLRKVFATDVIAAVCIACGLLAHLANGSIGTASVSPANVTSVVVEE